jgi:NHLM bacteriocin system ABC transporter peptidase/ATP-binding protein
MEAVECGAAALGIILAYYKRFVPLAELRQQCGVSRDGSKAPNILKAARNYGLKAKGFKKGLNVLKTLPFPYIIFWKFNHFLVVEGYSDKKVYLNDPANGRVTVSWEEFDESYTGIVLVMEPGADFKTGGKKRNLWLALNNRLKHSYDAVLFSLLAGLFLTLPRLAIPAFGQVFTDEILIQGQDQWIKPLLFGMVITGIIQGFLSRLRAIYLERLTLKLSVVMTGNFIWHLLHLPISFYSQRFAGEISNRTELNQSIVNILSRISTTVIDIIMLFFYLTLMLFYDTNLTIITLIFALINLIVLETMRRLRLDANYKISQERGKLYGAAISGLQVFETVKALGLESDLFTKFSGYYAKYQNSQQELDFQTQILNTLPILLTSLSVTVVLFLGGFRVIENNLTIGMLVAYQSLVISFLEPVNNLVNFGGIIQILEADLDRLDDVLQNPIDSETTVEFNPDLVDSFISLEGYIELRDLSFGYNPLEPPLIDNLNLNIEPGQRVAFVGGSGSGKSTIAKLITGLYTPWKGVILFDNIPRHQIPRLMLAESLAMVAQDIFLFEGSVRENLTLWDSSVPIKDIIDACKDADIHDLIMSLPGGYEALLTEGGLNISGGQAQRLEIARALVKNPAILVLDEATSALDAETELIIDQNIRKRGCTCVVVSHRLSTIRDCDEIIVLDQGQIVQRGTHEQLKSEGGFYERLISFSA